MNFKYLFKPETVAVIGVSSSNDNHPANVIYNKNHLRYPARVYPVNPRGGKIQRETLYKSISDIPERVDLAVIAVRADYVPDIIDQCIESNVRGAVIISGGFSETGKTDIQDLITEKASKAGFLFIGPNCLGIFSPDQVDTFFLPGERLISPKKGNVAIISQSGGVLVDQMVKFAGQGIGISYAVSIGNKALVREIDLLEFMAKDPETDVIAIYIEGFDHNEGRRFLMAAEKCKKPIVVLKAGKSSEGIKAVSSHTASMAGDYRVFTDVMKQFGIIEAENEFELTAFCECYSSYRKKIGGNIGIITISGGHGAVAADGCSKYNLRIPPFSDELQENIREKLPASIRGIVSLLNPIDMTGSSIDNDFIVVTNELAKSSEIDCILLLLLPYSPGITPDLGARLSNICRSHDKPLIAYVPNEDKYMMLIEGFELNNIPVSSSIDGAVRMAHALRSIKP